MTNEVRKSLVVVLALLTIGTGAAADQAYDPARPPRPCDEALRGLVPTYGVDGADFDLYIHLTIHDEAWARRILGEFFTREDVQTKRRAPAGDLYLVHRGHDGDTLALYYGDRRVEYFDRPGFTRANAPDAIVLKLGRTGVEFEFKRSYASRRRLELWMKDGADSPSRHVLTALSGLELYF